MIPKLEALVRSQTPNLGPRPLDFIKLHNGQGFRNPKVSFVAFQRSRPMVFLKTVRFSADNQIIERAHARLEKANQMAGLAGGAIIPKSLWCVMCDSVLVSAETMVAGSGLDRSSPAECAAIFSWLENWQKNTAGGQYSATDLCNLYETIKTEMKCSDPELLAYIDACFDRLAALLPDGARLPRVPAHGDFTPANILVRGAGKIGVIDWDRYGDIDIPLFDLLTLTERLTPKKRNQYLLFKTEIERQAVLLNMPKNAIPLLVFFYILLSDWRKREKFFPWELPLWDRDTLKLMREYLNLARAAFVF